MHALLFAGLLLSLGVVLVLLAGFFVHAWLFRRQETDSLLFGLTTFFFALYTTSGGILFQSFADPSSPTLRPWVDVGVGASAVAVACLIHFGLRFAQVSAERPIMWVVYGMMTVFVAVLAADRWWQQIAVDVAGLDLLGLRVPLLVLGVTPLAMAYHLCAPLGIAMVCALLWRDTLRGRRESRAAAIGAVVLTATATNDALALGTGWVDTVPLLPLGCVALVYGVSHTLLSRYGRLSGDLEQRTRELRRRSEQLAASLAERERTQEELVERERLATVGELAGVFAGEVRAPLRIVDHAVTELRREGAARSDIAVLLDSIRREMAHLDELVTSLLDYARPLVLHEAPVDLRPLLERAVSQARSASSIACRVADHASWPALNGDAALLGRAFANLVTSCAQAQGGDHELVLQDGPPQAGDDQWAVIEIVGTGEGRPRPGGSQSPDAGFAGEDGLAGLSWPLATRIVEAHGGTVSVTDQDGEARTVQVRLPRPSEREPLGSRERPASSATPS